MKICRSYRRIVESAVNLLREYYGLDYYIEIVGRGVSGDVSRRIDIVVEDYIADCALNTGFKTWILGEEKGLRKLAESPEHIVVVDPLDGSLNYALGIPFVAVSLAVYAVDNRSIASAIYSNVTSVFTNSVVEFCNGKTYYNRVEVVKRASRGSEVLSIYTENPLILSTIKEAFTKAGLELKTRTMGAASLEASYAALGFIGQFAHLTGKIRNIDLAAAFTVARALGAFTYTQPSLDEISITRLETISKVVIASTNSPLLSILDKL